MKTKEVTYRYIQFTAGTGPAECCWVLAQVLKRFIEELKNNNISYEVIHREAGLENGTLRSAAVRIQGRQLTSFLSNWLGTVQWIGISTFRTYHKRKNWFVGVYELENVQEQQINDQDIQFQAMRSSGPGGQHVNKVNSAIRATHLPTGIQVVAMDSRSQHQNRKLAVTRLREKVKANYLEQHKEQEVQQWENHWTVQRGNPVRIFKGSDFKSQKTNKDYKSKRQQLKNDLRKQQWDN